MSPAATTTAPRTRPRPPARAPSRPVPGARSVAPPRRAAAASAATATARALPAPPVPGPRSDPGTRRPQLRVVETPEARRRRVLRNRRWVVAGTFITAVAVFAVVAFHVMLAQGQVGLAKLQTEVSSAERDYQQARYARAQAASPERIVALAANMGLVPADRPPLPVAVPEPAAPSTGTSGGGTLDGYTTVKSSLADGP